MRSESRIGDQKVRQAPHNAGSRMAAFLSGHLFVPKLVQDLAANARLVRSKLVARNATHPRSAANATGQQHGYKMDIPSANQSPPSLRVMEDGW